MAEQDQLERSFRRLLRAYPRFYRRERELEILTTLLDAAKPGQVRATPGEAAHLILSGLRFRLVPPGPAAAVAAGIATLWLAVVLGGVGAYAAWDSSSADPRALDDPKLAALADTLVGQPPTWIEATVGDPLDVADSNWATGRLQDLRGESLPGVKPAPSGRHRTYLEVDATRGVLDAAYGRLRADGWHTGAITKPEFCGCNVFWANRDGLVLRMAEAPSGNRRSAVDVDVYPVEPRGVLAGAIAGFAVGLLAAWPVMTSLAHRCARLANGDRPVVALFGVAALLACFANTLDNVWRTAPFMNVDDVLLAVDLMYPLANQIANPLAASVIAVGFAVCVNFTVFTPWRRRHLRVDALASHTAVAGG
ncbi:hypothetical protein [Catellatospora sichuanensis]|uniref:hypothetical protein n=1 Tax=Catellatospora sichuanensis TaxID=1969805 RepID=UPI00118302B7|nr:hypothetical protein [Catellatospora sichuanensis]